MASSRSGGLRLTVSGHERTPGFDSGHPTPCSFVACSTVRWPWFASRQRERASGRCLPDVIRDRLRTDCVVLNEDPRDFFVVAVGGFFDLTLLAEQPTIG